MGISTDSVPEIKSTVVVAPTRHSGTGVLQLLLLSALFLLLYLRILVALGAQWIEDPNYSHGLFIPIFCSWVIWKEKARIRDAQRNPSWLGLLVILAALGILVLGVLGAENFLSRVSLLFLIAGMVLYFYGWAVFRAVLFPWICLFLMVPIPAIIFNQIALPLQFQASKLASGMLALLGIPVLREGNIIHLPSLTLDVVEACSGLRSLVSLIALATVSSYLFESRPLRRLLLVLAAAPIAVAANGFRIMGSGILGEYWSPEKAEGFFHLFSGLLVFLVSFGLLIALHGLFSLADRRFHRPQGRAT